MKQKIICCQWICSVFSEPIKGRVRLCLFAEPIKSCLGLFLFAKPIILLVPMRLFLRFTISRSNENLSSKIVTCSRFLKRNNNFLKLKIQQRTHCFLWARGEDNPNKESCTQSSRLVDKNDFTTHLFLVLLLVRNFCFGVHQPGACFRKPVKSNPLKHFTLVPKTSPSSLSATLNCQHVKK